MDHQTDPAGDVAPVALDTTSIQLALQKAVEEALGSGQEVALLFSGGLDSALLALLASRQREGTGNAPPKLVTVGLKGCHDVQAAHSAARMLEGVLGWRLELESMEITNKEGETGLRELLQIIGPDPQSLGFLLPLHLIAKRVSENVLISGQGADELFGGYARYRRMGPERLTEALKGDTRALVEVIQQRDGKIAGDAGKELACPYLYPEVRRAAEAISAEVRRGAVGEDGKELLREMAVEMGLPTELAQRPKKAAQYGTGFEKMVRAHFKELHTATLELEYPTPRIARAVQEATALDNPPFVALTRTGGRLTVKAAARTIGGLEQTLDDFLACADIAAQVVERAPPLS